MDRKLRLAPADAIVIGATDGDRSIEILLEVQFDAEGTAQDGATLDVIIESFMAG